MLIANVVAGWLSMNGTVGGIPWGASLAGMCDKQVCFNINAAIAWGGPMNNASEINSNALREYSTLYGIKSCMSGIHLGSAHYIGNVI